MRAAQRVLRAVVQSRVLWLCLGAMLVSSSAQAQSDVPGAVKWALVIGVQQYSSRTGFASLRYTEKDAEAFYDVLMDPQRGAYEDGRVKLLTTGAEEPDRQPTRGNILGALELLANWARADAEHAPDTVILYFSGHGVEQDGQSYLIPSDAARTDLDNTALSLDLVREKLALTGAKKQIVIVDACRFESVPGKAGGEQQSVEFARALEEFARAEGRVVLASCSSNQASYEDEERGHSAFTGVLLDGLLGAADGNGDAMITLTESYEYLTRELRSWAEKRGIVQYPSLYGEITLTLPLVRCPKWAELRISSVPDDAEMWIDGENSGHKTPYTLKLPVSAGQARTLAVRLKKDGYQGLTREVTLKADAAAEVIVGLKAMSGDAFNEQVWAASRDSEERSAHDGPRFLQSEVIWHHHVFADGSRLWNHDMQAGVTDPAGPANIKEVTVTDPTGKVHPGPGDNERHWVDETGYWLRCHENSDRRLQFSGVYTFVATNLQGKSTRESVTLGPVVDESVPVITYPPNGATIGEKVPVFRWEPIAEPARAGNVRVCEQASQKDVWLADLSPGQTSVVYNSDGKASEAELTPGHSYRLRVVASVDLPQGGCAEMARDVCFHIEPLGP